MLEGILQSSQYAPFIIFVAAALDIFFVTGLFLYGIAMISTIAIMHSTGVITAETIVIALFSGTVLGNVLNFGIGKVFHKSRIVAKKLEHPQAEKARGFLKTRGLFIYMLVCRFIVFTRPLYALLLGSFGISFKRFILYEILIAFAWTIFWLFIIIKGKEMFAYFFG
jgi:membrane protein DedA with SNARE-associated domain